MPSNCPPLYFSGTGTAELPPQYAPQRCPDIPARSRVWRSYLNVLLMSGTVLLPVYAEDRTYEEEAIGIWEDRGGTVVALDADTIAPYAGEFHCVAKTIDAPP